MVTHGDSLWPQGVVSAVRSAAGSVLSSAAAPSAFLPPPPPGEGHFKSVQPAVPSLALPRGEASVFERAGYFNSEPGAAAGWNAGNAT
jgi:hypothetical protein